MSKTPDSNPPALAEVDRTALDVPRAELLRAELDVFDGGSPGENLREDDLEDRAAQIVSDLVQIGPEDLERRKAAAGAVESMAVSVQREAARQSALLEEPLREISERGEDGGEVASSLVALRSQVETLDPGEVEFEPGWAGRLLAKIPGIGSPMRRYFARYDSAQRVIDDIIRSLQQGRDQLQRDNITLGEDQKALRESGKRLERAIALGRLVDQKLEYRLGRDLGEDETRARFAREELLFPLRQRIQDLQQQLAVNQQGYLTMEMIQRNNKELMRGVDRAVNVTVNALQVAVTLAMALTHQRITLEKVQSVTDTTNQLIAGTARRLKTQGAEIQKQAASATLDVETLRAAFTDINAALDDVSRYRQAALPAMAEQILEMDSLAKEAEASIRRAEDARQHIGSITIDL